MITDPSFFILGSKIMKNYKRNYNHYLLLLLNTFIKGGNLCSQLFVQNRNIIVPLSLIQIAGNWVAQIVFLCKFGNRESATIIAAAVRETWFVKLQFSILFVNQKNVTMQTSSFWWTRANISRQSFTFADIVARDVADEPVMPLENHRRRTKNREFDDNVFYFSFLTHLAVNWFLARRCVRIGHAQRIQSGCICIPFDLWNVFDLARCQFVAGIA